MKSVNLVASLPYHGKYEAGDFIGVDYGASYLFHRDIEMIAVIGDFDSLPERDYQAISMSDIEMIRLNPIKDETDLAVAINYAIANSYTNINVYGALGHRVDHTLININLLKKFKMIVLHDDYTKAFVLSKGKHPIDAKNYKYCSFFAIKNSIISLTGFKYQLTNYELKTDDTLCISNEIKGCPQVETNEDIIVVLAR